MISHLLCDQTNTDRSESHAGSGPGLEMMRNISIFFYFHFTEQYWHQGCYSQNIDKGPDVGGTRQDISDGSQCASFRAVECARACLKER